MSGKLNESLLCRWITVGKRKDLGEPFVTCLDVVIDLYVLDHLLGIALECYDSIAWEASTPAGVPTHLHRSTRRAFKARTTEAIGKSV